MRLAQIIIRNFRSIEHITFETDPTCQILVGKNEAGKSNILQALSLLNEDVEPSNTDVRVPRTNEEPIDSAYVRYVFALDEEDLDVIRDELRSLVLPVDMPKPLISTSQVDQTIDQLVFKSQGIYWVSLISENDRAAAWDFPPKTKLHRDWVKPSPACPKGFMFPLADGTSVSAADFAFAHRSTFADVPPSHIDELKLSDVQADVDRVVGDYVMEQLPRVIYWEYNEKNLLPGSVDMETFRSNPDSCIPLRNMFKLAGHDNVQEALDSAKKKPKGVRQLLERVAKLTTEHLHSVWHEYRDVTFDLVQNGARIEAGVHDKDNVYNLDQRSEGFKRFITFLLFISAEQKAKQLEEALIVIDEPDLGLHPSAARCLRDELLRLAKKNLVFYSTHSIFMIDSECIDRHHVVLRKNETTTLAQAVEDRIAEEEVLFKALGYSTLEILPKSNVVFEGWSDKKLFLSALERKEKLKSATLKQLRSLGTSFGYGVKDIRNVTSVLELAGRTCVVVSDSDDAGNAAKKEYENKKYYGTWYTYLDLGSTARFKTAEDFLSDTYLTKCVLQLSKEQPKFGIAGWTLDPNASVMAQLRERAKTSGITGDEWRTLKDRYKYLLFDKLPSAQIRDEYFNVLENVAQRTT